MTKTSVRIAALEAEIERLKKPPHVHRKVYYRRVFPRQPGAFNPEPMVRFGWDCITEDGGCGEGFDTGSLSGLTGIDDETRRLLGSGGYLFDRSGDC